MKRKSHKGFTIVELIIVIAVIAILAAVLIPTFSNIIKQAKLNADTQIIRNMNTALAIEEVTSGKNNDAYKAYEVLQEAGYLVERLNPTTEGYYYAFDALNNRMLMLDDNFDVYYPEEERSQTMDKDGNAWSIFVSTEERSNNLRKAFENSGKTELKATIVIPGTKLPSGVTSDTFVSAGEAKDGQDVVQAIATIDGKQTKFTDAKTAINSINDSSNGGTVYLPTNGTATMQTHQDLKKDVVIYANGADFGGVDISIGTYVAPESDTLNLTVYDAKNFHVWGQIGDAAVCSGKTFNIRLVNCTMEKASNEGLFYVSGAKNTVNLVVENCYVKGDGQVTNGIYINAGGSIKLYNSKFENCAIGVAISNKMESGDLTVDVQNCSFIACGTTNVGVADYAAPLRFVKKVEGGKVTATFKNNTFTDTVGNNGDVLLGEYRANNSSYAITANIISAKTNVSICIVNDGTASENGTKNTQTVKSGSSGNYTCGTRK